jgi:lipoate-protein ligase B
MTLDVRWLGHIPYREAWALQHALVAARADGGAPDTLLLLEHPRVLTLGRHATEEHVIAPADELAGLGVEVIRVERGGEVTYHGPGQLVAYPIVRLADRGLLIRPYVRLLEEAMIRTAAAYGVQAGRREGFPGAWCDPESPLPRKLGALGVRVERDVSYHGIALNVTTDLADFALINPCGLTAIGVTSIAREAGWPAERSRPSTASVQAAAERFAERFGALLEGAPVDTGLVANGTS